MRRLSLFMLFIVCLLALGCANGQSQSQPTNVSQAKMVDEYTPPLTEPPLAANLKITVNKPAAQVIKLIDQYAKSPEATYVVTHTIHEGQDKSLAVLILSLPDPAVCLDCGLNKFSYYNQDELLKEWKYEVAQKEIRLEFAPDDVLSRFMSLVAKANVTITALGRNQTEVSVSIDYALERKVTGYASRQLGEETLILPVSGISISKFSSTETGDLEDMVKCVSKGVVEQGILEGIKARLQ